MSNPIWTPARTVREVVEGGLTIRLTWERGEIVDAEVIDILDWASQHWRGLGKTIKHTPAERDGDAEQDAQLDRESER